MAKRYVAGRPVEIDVSKDGDGTDVQHFEPGDVVPGASTMPGLQGLVRNGYVVPEKAYNDADGKLDDLALLNLANEMEEG